MSTEYRTKSIELDENSEKPNTRYDSRRVLLVSIFLNYVPI